MAWTVVARSEALEPGGRMTVGLASRDVVVWRTAGGRLSACDARCPHQWAHLGGAGVVDGDELVCLSHGWRFDGDGEGSKLSATGRRDPKSSVETFAVRESAGAIEIDLDEGVLRIEHHRP